MARVAAGVAAAGVAAAGAAAELLGALCMGELVTSRSVVRLECISDCRGLVAGRERLATRQQVVSISPKRAEIDR